MGLTFNKRTTGIGGDVGVDGQEDAAQGSVASADDAAHIAVDLLLAVDVVVAAAAATATAAADDGRGGDAR